MKQLIVLASLALTLACQHAPPNLTPEATIAFRGTQAVHALDILRDTAIAANAQVPPLLPTATTRKVVLYHQGVVKIIQSSTKGWEVAAGVGLNELTLSLTPAEKTLLTPYIELVRAILREVP